VLVELERPGEADLARQRACALGLSENCTP